MRLFIAVLVILAGCGPVSIDIFNRPCGPGGECIPGFVCVDNVCLTECEASRVPDAGVSDGGEG